MWFRKTSFFFLNLNFYFSRGCNNECVQYSKKMIRKNLLQANAFIPGKRLEMEITLVFVIFS